MSKNSTNSYVANLAEMTFNLATGAIQSDVRQVSDRTSVTVGNKIASEVKIVGGDGDIKVSYYQGLDNVFSDMNTVQDVDGNDITRILTKKGGDTMLISTVFLGVEIDRQLATVGIVTVKIFS